MRHGRRTRLRVAAAVIFLLSNFLSSKSARAFPSSIGYGYGSCTTCHYNPAGNGPLTDYGRALFATVFAEKPFIQKLGEDDDTLTANSGFLGPVELPDFLRLSGEFRGMMLARNLQTNANFRAFPMQADGNLVLKFFDDRLFFSGTLGYAPIPSSVPESQRAGISTWISREHYLGATPTDWLGFYIGMMDPVFGLRVPEHTAFLRSQTGLDKNDQTHGLLVRIASERFELMLHGMLGNLLQPAELRQRGGSVLAELEVSENLRLGASFLRTENAYRTRQLSALHARLGIGEGASVMAEFGTNQNLNTDTGDTLGAFAFVQTSTLLNRGSSLLFSFEYSLPDSHSLYRQFRAGPSFQWIPMQRLELRFDFLATRTIDDPYVISPDDYTLQSQLHLAL